MCIFNSIYVYGEREKGRENEADYLQNPGVKWLSLIYVQSVI